MQTAMPAHMEAANAMFTFGSCRRMKMYSSVGGTAAPQIKTTRAIDTCREMNGCLANVGMRGPCTQLGLIGSLDVITVALLCSRTKEIYVLEFEAET
jgi:hypothetical protein